MANTIKVKRGTDANRVGVTPAEGELLYTTDTKKVYVGDGSTAGGNEVGGGGGGSQTPAELLADIKTVDGSGSGLDADLLDGNHASAFATSAQGSLADSAIQPSDNISDLTNDSGYITGNQTITLSGDVSGSGTTSISVTVADDSHNHIIANVDGLQSALDGKVDDSQVLTNVPSGAVFTDTTYSVGNGGLTEINFTSALNSKLAGIEAGATADQTASEILTAVKTVDGSGSGLDADLLDGQQGSYYAAASSLGNYLPLSGGTMTGQLSLSANPTGTTYGNGVSASPTHAIGQSAGDNDAWKLYGESAASNQVSMVFEVNDDIETVGNEWIFRNKKTYSPYTATTPFRISGAGAAYISGNTVWHSGNDGSGSGLDADLLDGQHASAFASASHNHSGVYLPVGGKAADSNLLDGLDHSQFLRDDGWNANPGQDANSQTTMRSDFTYSNNAPHTGELIRFGASGYSLQLNASYNDSTGRLSFRTFNNDSVKTWSPWRQIWHTGNDGSGSGLDADLLDGQQGSYYNWRVWNSHITWNNGINIGVSGESSFDMTSGSTWQVWTAANSLPHIKCTYSGQTQIGQAGTRGLYVYGAITATGNVTAYSDMRLKDNIQPIKSALEKTNAISGNTYQRKDLPDKNPDRRYAGVLAQEVEQVLPEAVSQSEDGIKTVDYNAVIALLVESVKELKSEVDDLKQQLEQN